MASLQPSDMLSRKLYLTALGLRSHPKTNATRMNFPSLLELAGLSTYDKPATPSIEENEFYDKYKHKLARLKSEKPTEFKDAVEKVYTPREKNMASSSKSTGDSSDVRGSSVLDRMRQTSLDETTIKVKPEDKKARPALDSIVKLDMLKDETSQNISAIWSEFFSKKEGVIYATVPADKYIRLASKGRECPMFVYSVPRESGYEFLLGQCAGEDWYYTPLISYQSHGEYAPYSLAVSHYTELMDTKGIVLMKGEIASNDLEPELATLLVHQTQLMYGSDENFKLVEQMNKTPDQFNHMSVIEISKKYGLF